MRFLKNFKAAEVAEDPAVLARMNSIASRSRSEASLYQAVKQAQRPRSARQTFRNARNEPE